MEPSIAARRRRMKKLTGDKKRDAETRCPTLVVATGRNKGSGTRRLLGWDNFATF